MEKITQNKKIIQIICTALAILLWIYVSYQENPSMSKTVKNVPIAISGEQALKENGLSVYSVSEKSVNVKATAKRLSLARITNKTISATINVSSIKTPGKHVLPAAVTSGISSNASYYVKGKDITVTIEPIIKKSFDLAANISTSDESSVLLKSHSLSDKRVVVSAPESIMQDIGYVQTEPIVPGTKDKSVKVKLLVYAKNGKLLEGAECTPSEVTVDYTLNFLKTLPIVLKTTDGGSFTLPSTYTAEICGSGEVYDSLKEIETQTIDISDYKENDKITIKLILPDGITLNKGIEDIEIELKKDYFKKSEN